MAWLLRYRSRHVLREFAPFLGRVVRIAFIVGGFPLISEFMSAGVPVGLGVDSSALAGDVNLFAVLKFAMAMENGRAGSEFKTARRARIRHAEWGKAASTLASV